MLSLNRPDVVVTERDCVIGCRVRVEMFAILLMVHINCNDDDDDDVDDNDDDDCDNEDDEGGHRKYRRWSENLRICL